jgi:hypothetical protein
MLYTVDAQPRDGRLHLYISPDTFAEVAGVSRDDAVKLLGKDEELWLTPAEAQQLGASFDELLSR